MNTMNPDKHEQQLAFAYNKCMQDKDLSEEEQKLAMEAIFRQMVYEQEDLF